jgi:hypothetical protein
MQGKVQFLGEFAMTLPFEVLGEGVFQSVGGPWVEVDKESVRWQFLTLFQRPNTAFRYFGSRRHELGIWSRGHFRFALFEASAMFAISLLWFVFPEFPFSLKSVLFTFFACFVRYFVFAGAAVSFVVCWLLNKFGLAVRSYRESHQDVEWRFCFDAFCNGTVAFMFDFLVGHFFVHIFELLFPEKWVVAFAIPNTLFLTMVIHFIYLFVRTLNVLPFIKTVRVLHFAIPPICIYIFSLIFNWKVPAKCLAAHFLWQSND